MLFHVVTIIRPNFDFQKRLGIDVRSGHLCAITKMSFILYNFLNDVNDPQFIINRRLNFVMKCFKFYINLTLKLEMAKRIAAARQANKEAARIEGRQLSWESGRIYNNSFLIAFSSGIPRYACQLKFLKL